jgi:SAM-dependent methyltransferase
MNHDLPAATHAIAANRTAWDRSAPFHRASQYWRDLVDGFQNPEFVSFDGQHHRLKACLQEISIRGKDVAQVCCNNGRETISMKRMGANRAVGFDQSAAFLAQAGELAIIAGNECEFVLADANDIPATYKARFDLVLITIGVFGWMPDLTLFMSNVAGLLKPNGTLLIYEEHPVVNMFEVASDRPLEAVNSYFRPRPFSATKAIVYDGSPAPELNEPHYWYVHPLSSVMTAVLDEGLAIESFREYGDNISSVEFDVLEKPEPILPLSYMIKACAPPSKHAP